MKKKEPTELEVHFKFRNLKSDPDEITKRLGIKPSHKFRIGEKIRKTILLRKSSGWWLTAKSTRTLDFEWHAERLLRKLQASPAFRELALKNDVCITCVAYIYNRSPSYDLSADFVRELAKYKAAIEIDIYDFRDPNVSYD